MADIGPLSQLHCRATIPPKKFLQGKFYPGCQRFFIRGFRFRRSCLPKTCRPAADEAPVTRENKPLVPRVVKLVFKKNLATGNT